MEFTIDSYIHAKSLGLPFAGKKASPKTLRDYTYAMQKAEYLLDKEIKYFDVNDVRDLMQMLSDEDSSQAWINMMISAHRGAFEWAIGNKLIEGPNPFKSVTLSMTTRRHLPKTLSYTEIELIFEQMRKDEKSRQQHAQQNPNKVTLNMPWTSTSTVHKHILILKLCAYGGLRVSEACELQKKHVRANGVVVNGKGSKERFIPIRDDILVEIKMWIVTHPYSPWVFYADITDQTDVETITPLHPQTTRSYLKLAAENCGIGSWVTPHVLRHTFSTEASKRGMRLDVLQEILGHDNIETTAKYLHIDSYEMINEYNRVFVEQKRGRRI